MPIGLVIGVLMLAEILMVVGGQWFGADKFPKPAPMPADASNTESLGEVLYTVYMYPFEIAAVILLVAIVAAIGLTMRRRPDTRYQDPGKQVLIKKGPDRVQVVSMPAEKRMDAE